MKPVGIESGNAAADAVWKLKGSRPPLALTFTLHTLLRKFIMSEVQSVSIAIVDCHIYFFYEIGPGKSPGGPTIV